MSVYKWCDFSEDEYCTYLYNELADFSPRQWDPGRVYEGHVGFDRAFMCAVTEFWDIFGEAPYRGRVINRQILSHLDNRAYNKYTPPNFALNLFVQAKRSEYVRKTKDSLKLEGLKSPSWRFSITPHQQILLEILKGNLSNRALVTYAAPAYHSRNKLFNNGLTATTVKNSTFPEVDFLTGHKKWYYSEAGFLGVANDNIKKIKEVGLKERVELLIKNAPATSDYNDGLSLLSKACRDTFNSDKLKPTTKDNTIHEYAVFFKSANSRIQNILKQEQTENSEHIVNYFTVRIFCKIVNVQWFVLG